MSKGEVWLFLYFYGFLESSKISVLKEWAELVASQLTQYLLKQVNVSLRKSVVGK